MKRLICMVLMLCLLLTGCGGWMDGSHVSVTPHQEHGYAAQTGTVSAANYTQLRDVLENLVESGAESGIIGVAEYNQDMLERGMESAVSYITEKYPVGAYAVEAINYEIGTGGGQPAISVSISYIHGRSEIRNIQSAADMEEAKAVITGELEEFSESTVLLIEKYRELDIAQMVADYAQQNPNAIMEVPQVAVGVYPDTGESRVVEVKFTYQTSRDALRQMKPQVQRVFTSAVYYVSSDATNTRKYDQLNTFLMERFDYKVETSITPSYSLLCHGVGDSKAFAMVYAAMCRQAELECLIVSGTRDGEPWYWNMILDGERYYHVDLLRSSAAGYFQKLTDGEMQGYVWDYSAYPEA